MAMSTPHTLYVLVEDEPGLPRPYSKIGITRDLKERLRSFGTSHPRPLKLLAAADTGLGGVTRARLVETAVHERFGHIRVRGEWFAFTEEITSFAAQIREYPESLADFAPASCQVCGIAGAHRQPFCRGYYCGVLGNGAPHPHPMPEAQRGLV